MAEYPAAAPFTAPSAPAPAWWKAIMQIFSKKSLVSLSRKWWPFTFEQNDCTRKCACRKQGSDVSWHRATLLSSKAIKPVQQTWVIAGFNFLQNPKIIHLHASCVALIVTSHITVVQSADLGCTAVSAELLHVVRRFTTIWVYATRRTQLSPFRAMKK